MKDQQPIILPDSPEAATYRTDITGWVSRDGLYFGKDEELARYSGCTHKKCECGNIFEKSWIQCEKCRLADKEKRQAEALAKMPRQEWDGETPLYEEASDRYLFDAGEVEDLCDDEGKTFDEMQFQICAPNHPRMIDTDDFSDDFPEDGEAPDDLVAAIEAFNNATKDVVLSWSPINVIAIEPKAQAATT